MTDPPAGPGVGRRGVRGPGRVGAGGGPGAAGFEVIPRRWAVERTCGRPNRDRRPAKGSEADPESSGAWGYIRATHRLSRFMLPEPNPDDHLPWRPSRSRKPRFQTASENVERQTPLTRNRREKRIISPHYSHTIRAQWGTKQNREEHLTKRK